MHSLAVAAVSALFITAFAAWLYLACAPRTARRAVRALARLMPRSLRRAIRGVRYHRTGRARHALPPAPETTPAITAARTA